ncbi:phospholipase/carboxylesterase [Enterococcus dispar]|nr:phospholipase/carboxylesterase [Enterococcus dispar]
MADCAFYDVIRTAHGGKKMKYLYDAGTTGAKKLLLLHGTGGDETSLVDIARFLDGGCEILSFRGEVEEDGMNRFFKRNGLNQFDLVSLEEETDNLYEEIKRVSSQKGVPLSDWILVGYSNGANIAAHLLLERETELTQGIFFHPMSLGVHQEKFSLQDKRIWLSFGQGDPIVSPASFNELATAFDSRGADLTIKQTKQGHQLSADEVNHARNWLHNISL